MCVFINHLGADGVLRSYDMKKVSINTELLEEMIGRQGISLKRIAKKAGICHQTLYLILRGKTCRESTAIKISKAMGTDVSDITKGE